MNDDYENDLKEKYEKLANLIFPDVKESIDDLEKRYPKRDLPDGAEVLRIAPSPTGFLHTGTLYTALANIRLAKQSNGVFYLRIEDTDRKREVKGSIALFTKELKAFGIVPDEGVIAENEEIGDYGPYTQSNRGDIYRICAKHLVKKGLAYPCFCTREMEEKRNEYQVKNKIVPGYYGVYAKCRNLTVDDYINRIEAGENYVLRFRSSGSHLKKMTFVDQIRGKIEMAQNDLDIIIIKNDGLPTYHFAHACDDHFMRTTIVIRGEEWLPSVPLHYELFDALGFDKVKYAHLSSVMVKDGDAKRKLSKRKDKEAAVSCFLEAGYPKESVLEYLLTILNSDFEPWRTQNKNASLEDFEVKMKKFNSAGALFDKVKLNDVSKEVISRMDSKEVLDRVLEWSNKYNKEVYDIVSRDVNFSQSVFALERDGAKKIRKDIVKWDEIIPTFFYFFNDLYEKEINENGYEFEFLKDENAKLNKENTKKVLEKYIEGYDDSLDKNEWFNSLKEMANELGFCTDMKEYKNNPDNYIGSTSDFAGTVRIAITNRHNSPDIYQIMKLLGKEEVINRLKNAANNI